MRTNTTLSFRFTITLLFLFSVLLAKTETVSAQCGPVISSFPYNEGFEVSAAWTSGGTASDWVWGTPAHPLINSAGGGTKSWCVGGLAGSFYNNNEQSWLMSPCFDFTSLTYPWLSFKIFWECERQFEGMQLQYSLNGGTTWTRVGNFGDPVDCLNQNWYNINNVTYLNLATAGTRHAWSGRVGPTSGSCSGGSGSGAWVTATHCLTGLAGQPSVRFRFIFGAGSTCNNYDGIALDDILIQNAAPNNANFSFACTGGSTVNFTNLSALCPTGYSWNFGDPASGAANTSTATNPTHTFSAGGTYNVTLNVSGPCNAPSSVVIPVTVLAANITSVNPTCNGSTNGSATANVTGTGPFTYAWTPGGQTTQTATNLIAGVVYTVTVTAAGSCSATSTVTLTQPPPMTATISGVTNVSCFGGSNGSVSVVAGGGGGGYTYAWTPVGGTNATATGLGVGSYTITVTDVNGCTQNNSTNISSPTQLNANITSTTNTTCGGSNGSATVSASGGSPAYSYAWTPIGGTGTTASGLPAGTYTATVTDNKGCTRTATTTVGSIGGVSASITSSTNVSCFGGSNGSATVTPVGGLPGYSYAWAPSGGTGAVAGSLGFGTYTVTVTDGNSCTSSATVTITQPAQLTATISAVTPVSCSGGANGSATVTAGGGAGGYTYVWTPSGGNGTTASSLMQGIYTVTVTDANSCTISSTTTITQPTPVTASITSTTPVSCFGGSNGTTTVTAGGGAGGYTYAWVPSGGSAATATGLALGIYTVTVTDANGCSQTATTTITQPTQLTAAISGTTDITCFGSNNGTATVTAGGGVSGYTYAWAPSGGTGTAASGLAPGNYTVTVSDANSCTVTATTTLTQPAAFTLSLSATDMLICPGEPTTISTSPTGGTAGYTFTWSGGLPPNTSNTVSPMVTTTYSVTATDANSCTATSSITIVVDPAPTATLITNAPICENNTLNISASGGNSYSWTGPGGFSSASQNLSFASATINESGIYTVTVTNLAGCSITNTITATVNPLPQANFAGDNLSGCTPVCTNFSDLSSVSTGSINTWNWTADGTSFSTVQNPTHCFTNPGSYDIMLTVTTADGCSSDLTFTNYIVTDPNPVAQFTVAQTEISETDPFVRPVTPSQPFISSWQWDFGDGSTSSQQNPMHEYTDTGTYCIQLTVTTPQGCSDNAQVCVTVYPEYFIYIPNSFTPNLDDLNETWFPEGRGLNTKDLYIEVHVFNRWGERVFLSTSSDKPWNGYDQNVGSKCPEGVYVYRVIYIYKEKEQRMMGNINLIR